MGLKYLQFTNGEKLPLYAVNDVYDDTYSYTIGTMVFTTLENSCLTVGLPSGGFLNPNLSGKRLKDLDGHIWDFLITGDTLNIKIYNSDGTLADEANLDADPLSGGKTWFMVCNRVEADNYGIGYGYIKPSLQYDIRGTGNRMGMYTSYVNGYSEDNTHNYFKDIQLLKLVPSHAPYVIAQLRNATKSTYFCDTTGIIFNADQGSILGGIETYLRPYSARVVATTPLPISFSKSIKELNPDDEGGTDPYKPGGTTGPGGGEGDFDNTSDAIDFPSLPTLSATDTGFITIFNPTTAQLKDLAQYMWSSGFDLATFKKLFADPMDCILGLSIVPVNVPNGGSKTVSVGNISTGVSMTLAASQYVEIDCGTLNVNEYWGAYLDYDPYTKAEIYLPYIGTHAIAVDDIMKKPVHVVYHVDILSGACTAFVKCGDSVLYEFIGQCAASIPISGNDWTNVINGVMSIAGSIGTMVATGGMSAPLSVAHVASTAVNSLKPSVEKSGAMSGTGGLLGIQTPYLILTRPRQALPEQQKTFTGYPSFITSVLSDVSGYTEIEEIHLQGITATEAEQSEIEALLKAGVIL